MIKTAHSLWTRSIEIAKESLPECFMAYPYADALRLGWYPSHVYFEEEVTPAFWRALPHCERAAVMPYFSDHQHLSHLIINPYREDGELHPSKRFLMPHQQKKVRPMPGIFGIQRLKGRKQSMAVTDDEVAVLKHDDIVAVSAISPKVADVIRSCTRLVNLRSDNPKWVERMIPLTRQGIQLTINDKPLYKHIVDTIVRMHHDRIGLSILSHRTTELLSHLLPIERKAILQMLKEATNLNFEHVLPDDFHIYRREGEFYDSVEDQLTKAFSEIVLDRDHLILCTDSESFRVPLNKHAVSAAICQALDVKLDLVDWAYRDLKEIPHFYLYRDKHHMVTRAEVSAQIAEVALAVLTRRARIMP